MAFATSSGSAIASPSTRPTTSSIAVLRAGGPPAVASATTLAAAPLLERSFERPRSGTLDRLPDCRRETISRTVFVDGTAERCDVCRCRAAVAICELTPTTRPWRRSAARGVDRVDGCASV
jgi:hypothetical protein